MKFRVNISALLLAAALTAACDNGAPIELLEINVTDSGNYSGKWSSSDELSADIYASSVSAQPVSSGTRLLAQDAKAGIFTLEAKNLERVEHTLVLYSPSSLEIPSGQSSTTKELRMGSAVFTPAKSPLSITADVKAITSRITVNLRSENQDYMGWTLENVSFSAPSPICGKVAVSPSGAQITEGESTEALYEISSPSALRTKAQSVTFTVFPSVSQGNKVTLGYTLSKDGKRVLINHTFAFTQTLAGGETLTLDETIPAAIDGEWTAGGSGVKYTSVFPGSDWETASPESRGYSSTKLAALRAEVEKMSTTSLMIAVGGKVIFSYGDVTENVKIASCRKSLLSTLYGKYVENGTIDLSKTLRELGIDEDASSWGGVETNWDGGALLESEKDATIQDLLTARSGIFHKPANSGDDHSYMKASDRGKYPHGTYYLYNNWDFNCAGGVFEQLTGCNIYEAFKTDIADPCHWQDYLLSNQKKTVEYEGASRFPAYHFWISTRDMLRMALLMLNKGNWDGNQVVSQAWAEKITTTFTKRADMHPSYRLTREFEYGWLWWTFCPQYTGYDPEVFEGGFTATGSGGQYFTALPALDMVIAHKDKNQDTEKSTYYNLIKKIAACRQ